MPPVTPIDPLTGPKLALSGRVVTMDESFEIIEDAVIFIEHGNIVAVQDAAAPPPAGFAGATPVATGGTIFPGLIELHNHLSYNALRLWDVPKKFEDRSKWGGTAEYRRLVSGPMQVLGRSPGLLPAVVRYVECKCLLGGVTTSQGIELFSNQGARRFYRGIVRNVEQTDEPELPEAATKIADVEATDAERFLARLLRQTCFLLHLSEGTDKAAREHFLALHFKKGKWAITSALAGIHCAALKPTDFNVMASHQASMVWSPLSNLLLYGDTAKVKDAKAKGVKIGIGSDWSPTGSKNLLGELKVARLYSQNSGDVFSDRDIVAMATREAATILKWEKVLGSIEASKRADLLVIDSVHEDPYAALLKATEGSIQLVMINGIPRFGVPSLMKSLGVSGETIQVGGQSRKVCLEQATADPVVGTISLTEAKKSLAKALKNLPALAEALEGGSVAPPRALARALSARTEPLTWSLALDELSETGMELRPRLPLPGRRASSGPSLLPAPVAKPLSQIVQPLELDSITVVDDDSFLDRIAAQRNLPEYIRKGLKKLYQ